MVFFIMRMVPGGPMQQDLQRMMGQGSGEKSQQRGKESQGAKITPDQLLELAEKHNRAKPAFNSYLEWLGVLPRDVKPRAAIFAGNALTTKITIPGTENEVEVKRDADGTAHFAVNDSLTDGWKLRLQSPQAQFRIWKKFMPSQVQAPADTPWRVVMHRSEYRGLLQGSLGMSQKYQEPVSYMIRDCMPVSLFYGVLEILIIYSICIPLGMLKAIKHRTWLDNASSILVFIGYAIPSYALGAFLVQFVCAKGWFPLGGFTSDDFGNMNLLEKTKDLLYHAAMPLVCYLIGGFAMMTMLVKNSLMDELAADYVRTAVAKGVSFHGAIFKHALKNSLIPIAATVGHIVGIFVTGSMLIEKIFDINGFGLLQYNALLELDEPVVMGTLAFSAFLLLIGNIISDIAVAMVNPKISFA